MADDAAAGAASALEQELKAKLPAPVILISDLAQEAREQCIAATQDALVRYKTEKDQAMHVKKALEEFNGALWMVVIGQSFGASVAHEHHALFMFRIGRVKVLAFQAYDEGMLINTRKEPVGKGGKRAEKKEDDEGGGGGGGGEGGGA